MITPTEPAPRACDWLWSTDTDHACGLDTDHDGNHICGAGAPWGACAEYNPDTQASRQTDENGDWSDWTPADGHYLAH